MDTVYIFGNEELVMDAVPIMMMPDCALARPDLSFVLKDPNEDWNIPEFLTVIDTVVGITEVRVFDGLTSFVSQPHVSVHDFDAYANLRFLQKLGKLKNVRIIGIPAGMRKEEALPIVLSLLPPRKT